MFAPVARGAELKSATLYLLDSEGILLCHASRRLYYLNTTAAFIWCCLEEGLDQAAIAEAVAEQFGISHAVAERDIFKSLSLWEREGLAPIAPPLVSEEPTSDPPPGSHSAPVGGAAAKPKAVKEFPDDEEDRERIGTDQHAGPGAAASNAPRLPKTHAERCYRVGDAMLRVRYGSAQSKEIVDPVLRHLAESPAPAGLDSVVTIDIREGADGFSLFRRDEYFQGPMPGCELAPAVHREALLTAYDLTDCLAAVHAAAVCDNHGCLLLPATSGSGKSTLTAALINEGFVCVTDELAFITPDTHLVRPIPVSVGLKRGSWTILGALLPGLDALPIFHQADGTEVRYVAPSGAPRESGHPARGLVFPKYEPQRGTKLTPISKAEALFRLAEAGYAIPGHLEPHVVEGLIQWIRPLACYELQVDILEEAVSEIKRLFA